MAEPLRHRQTKGAETDMPSLPPPRHIPTLPMDNASILSRRDVRPLSKPTRKEVSPAPGTKAGKPILNRCAGLLGNFELNRPTCFLLNHRRSVSHPAADTHVIGVQPDEITTPKFAVDSKVGQREVTFSPLQLE